MIDVKRRPRPPQRRQYTTPNSRVVKRCFTGRCSGFGRTAGVRRRETGVGVGWVDEVGWLTVWEVRERRERVRRSRAEWRRGVLSVSKRRGVGRRGDKTKGDKTERRGRKMGEEGLRARMRGRQVAIVDSNLGWRALSIDPRRSRGRGGAKVERAGFNRNRSRWRASCRSGGGRRCTRCRGTVTIVGFVC